jgi:hypothetical protein
MARIPLRASGENNFRFGNQNVGHFQEKNLKKSLLDTQVRNVKSFPPAKRQFQTRAAALDPSS